MLTFAIIWWCLFGQFLVFQSFSKGDLFKVTMWNTLTDVVINVFITIFCGAVIGPIGLFLRD